MLILAPDLGVLSDFSTSSRTVAPSSCFHTSSWLSVDRENSKYLALESNITVKATLSTKQNSSHALPPPVLLCSRHTGFLCAQVTAVAFIPRLIFPEPFSDWPSLLYCLLHLPWQTIHRIDFISCSLMLSLPSFNHKL